MTYPRVGGHSVFRLLAVASALVPALMLTGPSGPALPSSAVEGTGAGTASGEPATGDRRPGPVSRDRNRTATATTATPTPIAGSAVHAPRIREIQGRAHRSPLTGTQVTGLTGVVTALTGNGFWMQDTRPDGDEATAEGIFVFTRTRPWMSVGDQVTLDGRVAEFRPGGSGSTDLTRTELDAGPIRVTAHDVPLPEPVVLGPAGRRPPATVIENDLRGDAESARPGTFDPEADGLDFYESLEGMRVAVDEAVVVGPRSQYGEAAVLPANGAGASVRSARGGIVLRQGDANPERVVVDDTLASIPAVNVGDRLPGRNVGVLDYRFGDFKLLLTATPQVTGGGAAPESTRPQLPDEVAIATVDVDDLDPSDPPERFTAHARAIVDRLRSPDLVVIERLQDNSGAEDDGTVAADQTVAQLIAAISAAGGPAYDWRSIDPRNNADGGEPGGNIRVGFLFRADRGLEFTDRPGAGSAPADPADPAAPTVAVDDGAGRPRLTLSPGRVNPAGPAWTDVRKPLAGEFAWHGRPFFVIANHWTSSGGDDPLYGRRQPPRRPSEAQRTAQARIVADFVTSIRTIDQNALVVVAGNLNDSDFSAPVRTLTRETGLVDLPARLPVADRYTSVVAGNAQVLDHILVSPVPGTRPPDFDIVHTTADFAGRAGAPDPSIVRITVPARTTGTAGS